MRPSTYISEHIRHNVVGYVALFCFAIGGFAQALPGKNKVDSGDIKKGQVKVSDLAPNSVDSTKVVDNSLTGADVDDSSLSISVPSSLPPNGAAGGDLSGTYPNPEVLESGLIPGGDLAGTLATAAIANNSIGVNEPTAAANDEIADGGVDTEDVQNASLTGTDIANDSLTGSDISNGGTLGDVEIGDQTRSILIPASTINQASIDGEVAANSDPQFGFAPISKAPAVRFDANTNEAINLITMVPDDRVAGTDLGVTLHWSSTATGSVTWTLEALSRGNGEASNAAQDFQSESTDGISPNTLSVSPNVLIPSAAVTNGEALFLRVSRNAIGEPDDLNADAFLHLVEVTYTAER